jgi:pimeloyl-ACP methyl ester carboxylesterase
MSKTLILLIACVAFASASIFNVPPEANYDFPQYIQSLNHPYEQHTVTTSDGYVLTYFRIQKQFGTIVSGLPPILLHHGLLDSADSFIINDEDQAPGLLLANLGYDIWLGNSRGNKYGAAHTTLDPTDPNGPFWDFSWQDMSEYDLPAGMAYVAQVTGQKVTYIGHSQGTSIMIAALARRDPTILANLNKFIALAPVSFVQHSQSVLVRIAGWLQVGTLLKDYDKFINRKMFAWESDSSRKTMEDLCSVALDLCVVKLRLISDLKTSVDNTDRLVVTQGHFPAGTSIQNMVYWQQMFNNEGTFKYFDYGSAAANQAKYGQSTPPTYDLSQIKEPMYLFAGQYDELASPADTQHLQNSLTGSSNVFYKLYPLGHSSFVYGKDVAGYMQDVIPLLSQ